MRGLLIITIPTLVIVLVGTASVYYLEKTAVDLTDLLMTAQNAVAQKNWTEAEEMVAASLERWQQMQRLWTVLINHKELDEIRMALERSSEYVASQDETSALAELAVAKLLVKHIPEKEKLSLSNIL